VRLLVDTHVLLWAVGATRSLESATRRLLEDGRNQVFFSSISIFEIAAKRAAGRRSAPSLGAGVVLDLALRLDMQELQVSSAHALAVEAIALMHPDPFDRMLLAQAQVEDMRLVTHDETLASYDSRTILF